MRKERGNILFLILLAVVLFAALAYAVTSSMRGGGKDASSETVQAGAAAISQYVALLRNEIQRLMLMNDCKFENLDWRSNAYFRYNGSVIHSQSAALVPKAGCAIFTAYGGPVTPLTFEKYVEPEAEAYLSGLGGSTWKAGHPDFRWINRKNEGSPANDIGLIMDGISKPICSYLLNPQNPPALMGDSFDYGTYARNADPGAFTDAGSVVDSAINMNMTDFFASTMSLGSGKTSCKLGAVIIPQ